MRTAVLVAAVQSAAAAGVFAQTPAPAVVVETVAIADVAPRARFTGRVESTESVDMPARVQSVIAEQHFRDGQDVSAGDLLFTLDPDTYQAAVLQAKAQVDRADAILVQRNQAYDRASSLLDRQAVSQSQVDQAQADKGAAAADLSLARANLKAAEINLEHTRISAPFSGRVGRAAFKKGSLVGPAGGPLVRLISLDPIRVVFSLNERDLLTVKQAADLSLDDLNGMFTPKLHLPNGTEYPSVGKIEFVDNEADKATGTVAVRTLFDNRAALLLPGQTVVVEVEDRRRERVPVVPIEAVQEDVQGRFVFVVDDKQTAKRQGIETGRQVGQSWAVPRGLRGGETIVVEGLQKVRAGLQVRPTMRDARAAK